MRYLLLILLLSGCTNPPSGHAETIIKCTNQYASPQKPRYTKEGWLICDNDESVISSQNCVELKLIINEEEKSFGGSCAITNQERDWQISLYKQVRFMKNWEDLKEFIKNQEGTRCIDNIDKVRVNKNESCSYNDFVGKVCCRKLEKKK